MDTIRFLSFKKTRKGVMLTLELNLNMEIVEDDGHIIAHSKSLNFTAAGLSEEEARRNFNEAVTMLFEDLIERKKLDVVLRKLGWSSRNVKSIDKSNNRHKIQHTFKTPTGFKLENDYPKQLAYC